jgi:hypothetical protein
MIDKPILSISEKNRETGDEMWTACGSVNLFGSWRRRGNRSMISEA